MEEGVIMLFNQNLLLLLEFSTKNIIIFIIFLSLAAYLIWCKLQLNYLKAEIKELNICCEKDALTGVANRTSFYKIIENFKKINSGVTVLVCDIDGLKAINDQYGHFIGDKIIRQAANLLESCCPELSYLFRMGGDEFLILIPEILTKDQREQIVSKIHWECSKNDKLKLSLGIASSKDKQYELIDVIREADEKMYKSRGTTINHSYIEERI